MKRSIFGSLFLLILAALLGISDPGIADFDIVKVLKYAGSD